MKKILGLIITLGFCGNAIAAYHGSMYDPLYVVGVSTYNYNTGDSFLLGNTYFGAIGSAEISSITAAGNIQAAHGITATTVTVSGAVSVGALTGTSTMDIAGNVYEGAANFVSTMTGTTGAWAITGSVVSLGDITGVNIHGNGSALTGVISSTAAIVLSTGVIQNSLNAVIVSTGAIKATQDAVILSTGVIKTSLDSVILSTGVIKASLDAVILSTGGAIIATSFSGDGAGLTAITAANISGGTLGITVKPYSVADCKVLQPATEGEWCYSTGAHTISISTSTQLGGFAPLTY